MSKTMSSAEFTEQFTEQFAELLPARTVLSLSTQSLSGLSPWHADTGGTAGAPGDPGIHGGNGQSIGGQGSSSGPNIGNGTSIPRVAMWALFGQPDPGPGPSSHGFGDAVSHSG
jgi:hypothetical protein